MLWQTESLIIIVIILYHKTAWCWTLFNISICFCSVPLVWCKCSINFFTPSSHLVNSLPLGLFITYSLSDTFCLSVFSISIYQSWHTPSVSSSLLVFFPKCLIMFMFLIHSSEHTERTEWYPPLGTMVENLSICHNFWKHWNLVLRII